MNNGCGIVIILLTALTLCQASTAIPERFEKNEGQFDPRWHYVLRQGAANYLFTKDGVTAQQGADQIRIHWPGADWSRPSGEAAFAFKTTYIQSNRRTVAANYHKLRYRQIYSGIDIVFYLSGGTLEFDWELAPGASPRHLKLATDPGVPTRILPSGALSVGPLVLGAPRVFQGATELKSRYLLDGRTVRVQIENLDPAAPVRVDPTLEFRTFFPGTAPSFGYHMARDRAGNIVIAGVSTDTALPTTPGSAFPVKPTLTNTLYSIFVMKLATDGKTTLALTYLGGNSNEQVPSDMTLDADDNVILTGMTQSITFPTTPGAISTPAPTTNTYLTILSANLQNLRYSTMLAPVIRSDGGVNAIAVDAAGLITLTGGFSTVSTVSLQATPNAMRSTPGANGAQDGFILRIDPTRAGAAAVLYASFLPGTNFSRAIDLAVDPAGIVFLLAQSDGTVAPTPGAFRPIPQATDGFLYRLDLTQSGMAAIQYATWLGGPGQDEFLRLVRHPDGDLFVAAITEGARIPTSPGAWNNNSADSAARLHVVQRLDIRRPAAEVLRYTASFAPQADTYPLLAVDNAGNVFHATDHSTFPNLPTVGDSFQRGIASESTDIYLVKLTPQGAVDFATYVGGSNFEDPYDMVPDQSGGVFLLGRTSSPDLFATAGVVQGFIQTPPTPTGVPQPGLPSGFLMRIGGQPSGCTYSISATRAAHTAPGKYSFMVQTQPNCVWRVTSAGRNVGLGMGTSAYVYEIADIPQLLNDYTTYFIEGIPFVAFYEQSPGYCSNQSAGPRNIEVGPDATTAVIVVSTSSGCRWRLFNNPSWVELVGQAFFSGSVGGGGSGLGPLSINARISALPAGVSSRTATMQAAFSPITITQSRRITPPELLTTESAGGGNLSSTVFEFNFRSTGGRDYLSMGSVVITRALNDRNNCQFWFSPAGAFFLASDDGLRLKSKSISPGAVLENSFCRLQVGNAVISGSGNDLKLRIPVEQKRSVGPGQTVYANVLDQSGATSGWQPAALWAAMVPPPSYPSPVTTLISFCGADPAWFANFDQDPNGPAIRKATMIFNPRPETRNSCVVEYDNTANLFYLLADDGATRIQPGMAPRPNANRTVRNSQCTLRERGLTRSLTGNRLTLGYDVGLDGNYGPRMFIFGQAEDTTGKASQFWPIGMIRGECALYTPFI